MSANNLKPKRVQLSLKDVQVITGCSERTAIRRIALIREMYHKPKPAIVTIEDYCSYYLLDYENILKLLNLI